MNKIIFLNSKILYSYIILMTIPIFFSLIFLIDSWFQFWFNYKLIDFLFIYNFVNWWVISDVFYNTWYNFIIIVIYNYFLILLFFNISRVTQKYILIISFILSLLCSIYWYVYIWIQMSV